MGHAIMVIPPSIIVSVCILCLHLNIVYILQEMLSLQFRYAFVYPYILMLCTLYITCHECKYLYIRCVHIYMCGLCLRLYAMQLYALLIANAFIINIDRFCMHNVNTMQKMHILHE